VSATAKRTLTVAEAAAQLAELQAQMGALQSQVDALNAALHAAAAYAGLPGLSPVPPRPALRLVR
jgi:hypothetical protein